MKRFAIVVALALAACPSTPPMSPSLPTTTTLPTTVLLTGEAFASDWAVSIVVATERERVRAQTLTVTIDAALAEVSRQVSAWDKNAEVTRFSDARHLRPLHVSHGTALLVDVALGVAESTGGAFDPTIGPLLDVWGFSPRTKGMVTSIPSPEAIAAARALVGWRHVQVHDGLLSKDTATATLDVTSIADGAGASTVAVMLRERGFANFLVDVAGEIVVAGHGEGHPWRVGINTPSVNAAATDSVRQAVLSPSSSSLLSLSTSGTYREGWDKSGHRYSHIIDPRTGSPVAHDLVSCTLVGVDAVVADALSTACVVLGEPATRLVLAEYYPGYEALFIHAPTPTTFSTTTTTGFPPAP